MVFLGHLLTATLEAILLGGVAFMGVKLGINLRKKKDQANNM